MSSSSTAASLRSGPLRGDRYLLVLDFGFRLVGLCPPIVSAIQSRRCSPAQSLEPVLLAGQLRRPFVRDAVAFVERSYRSLRLLDSVVSHRQDWFDSSVIATRIPWASQRPRHC